MTNIVIDNGAATPVAKTFTQITASAGDGSSAKWALKEGPIAKAFPRIELSARANSATDTRKGWLTFTLPSFFTDTDTGMTTIGSGAQANLVITLPNDFPEALKDDFQAYVCNLFSEDLIKAFIRDAYSAS